MKKNPIFWFKYRQMYAWGYTIWKYNFFESVEGLSKKDILEEFMDTIDRQNTWSDKYRKVEVELVKTVPKVIFENKINSINDSIASLKEQLINIKKYTKVGKREQKI